MQLKLCVMITIYQNQRLYAFQRLRNFYKFRLKKLFLFGLGNGGVPHENWKKAWEKHYYHLSFDLIYLLILIIIIIIFFFLFFFFLSILG